MKGKFVQIAAIFLSATLLLGLGGVETACAAPASPQVIRVGLHYGSGAMEGLNFLNSTGSGYRFGYYDGDNRFVALGSTPQSAISVVKTVNVYYGSYNGYNSYHSALTSSAVAVGEYHLQAAGPFSTFAEAQAAAGAYPGGFPAYIGGAFYARIGNYTTRAQAVDAQTALAGQGVATTLAGTSKYSVNVVATGTNTILFQFDDQGAGTGLGLEPNAAGAGRYVTLSKGYQYHGGFRFERIDGGSMTVVNIVEFEDYVEGVVATEMSKSWPVEALKTQAVAARSYAVSLGAKHKAHHFDICNDVDCQAYTGQTNTGANTRAAVEQTAGQVALYNGKAAQTFYYSSNGGASESSSTVWGGNQNNYPYLVGKADPYEAASGVKNDWTKTVTSARLVSGLRGLGYSDVGDSIVSIAVKSLTDSGNPKQLTFTDNSGKQFTVNSRYVVNMLGLRSYRYGFDAAAQQPSSPASGGVSVNGSAPQDAGGLYAIDGSGNISAIPGDAYVVTDQGVSPLQSSGGGTGSGTVGGTGSGTGGGTVGGLGALTSTTGQNGSFTFVGKGWGHNVGMSQFGAYAMANQGYTYLDILRFYYTGITVGYM